MLFFLLLLFLFLIQFKFKLELSLEKLMFIAFAIRMLAIILFPHSSSEDLTSFVKEGQILLSGKKIYPGLYFPFFSYTGVISIYLKNIIDPLIFIKIVFSLFDIGIVYLIYLLTKKTSAALLYGLNPITTITTAIHGQFDTAPLFFLLLGIYFFMKKKILSSLFSISLGIFSKTWPVLFVIPLFRLSKKKLIYLLIFLIPAVSIVFHSLFFRISLTDIILPIKNYRGLYGVWGITQITDLVLPNLTQNWVQLVRRVLLLFFIIYSLFYKFKNPLSGVTKLMLFFFLITPTFGAQWLTWIIPFLIISKPKNYLLFFLLATFYVGLSFYPNVYPIAGKYVLLWENSVKILGLTTWFSLCLLYWNYRKVGDYHVR